MRKAAFAMTVAAALTLAGCSKISQLIPPDLPEQETTQSTRWLAQNWSNDARYWFHHTPQGTQTIPVPYRYFINLEQPILFTFGDIPLFREPDYLARFGFISSPKGEDYQSAQNVEALGYSVQRSGDYTVDYRTPDYLGNPDGLPVGFALTRNQTDPTTGRPLDPLLGFTCAACHTGQLNYAGVNIRVDGGPAVTNLSAFTEALAAAIGQTRIIPWRLTRFAKRLYGPDYSDQKRDEVKATLDAIIAKLGGDASLTVTAQGDRNVEEGFARLDALNRIGNQVFFSDIYDSSAPHSAASKAAVGNIAPTDAPVNYPHIWSTSWFDWVQYDASIMQPMVRNAGESLGVRSAFNLTQPLGVYESTLLIRELYKMEDLIAGPDPRPAQRFSGLTAPKWPEDVLGPIDQAKAKQGALLYAQHCAGCHLPATNSADFWSDRYWKPLPGAEGRYLALKTIPVEKIGTDGAQAAVLDKRTVELPAFLGVPEPVERSGGLICDGRQGTVADETYFAWALAYVTEKAVDNRYDRLDPSPSEAERFELNGKRPNCVRAINAYKARPLNGIWATAPFLHNGSVLTLYDMLIPADERPEEICLGDLSFDAQNVGMVGACLKGATKVDTTKPGNRATGHSFEDGEGPGVIGPALSEPDRRALIEYLKTL